MPNSSRILRSWRVESSRRAEFCLLSASWILPTAERGVPTPGFESRPVRNVSDLFDIRQPTTLAISTFYPAILVAHIQSGPPNAYANLARQDCMQPRPAARPGNTAGRPCPRRHRLAQGGFAGSLRATAEPRSNRARGGTVSDSWESAVRRGRKHAVFACQDLLPGPTRDGPDLPGLGREIARCRIRAAAAQGRSRAGRRRLRATGKRARVRGPSPRPGRDRALPRGAPARELEAEPPMAALSNVYIAGAGGRG